MYFYSYFNIFEVCNSFTKFNYIKSSNSFATYSALASFWHAKYSFDFGSTRSGQSHYISKSFVSLKT